MDTNGNTVSDLWEREVNAGVLLATFDPAADSDGDGWTNATEAIAGTHPFSSTGSNGKVSVAVSSVAATSTAPQMFRVAWNSLPGKRYRLWFSPDLSLNSWSQVGPPIHASGLAQSFDMAPALPAGGMPARGFWRVSVENVDSNNDGVTNRESTQAGANPYLRDTDGDGVRDFDEMAVRSTSPTSAADGDADGIPDDFEKDLAKKFLAYKSTAAEWSGAEFAALSSGDLDAAHSYSGDGVSAVGAFSLIVGAAAQAPETALFMVETQSRTASIEGSYLGEWTDTNLGVTFPVQNDITLSLSGPRSTTWPFFPTSTNSGVELEDANAAWFGARIGQAVWNHNSTPITIPGAWSTPSAASSAFGSYHSEADEFSRESFNCEGRLQQHTFRYVATDPAHGGLSKSFLHVISTREPDDNSGAIGTVVSATPVTVTIPAGQLVSNTVIQSAPLTDGKRTLSHMVPMDAAVDADRDGAITFDGRDATTQDKPFRFWVNNDVDRGHTVDDTDWEEDDLNPAENQNDASHSGIECARDLEDFARVWIDLYGISQVFNLSDPAISLCVRFQPRQGNPSLRLYRAVDADGGTGYLTDPNTGFNQLQSPYGTGICLTTGNQRVEIPRIAWETMSPNKVVRFLFEAVGTGEGELIFELLSGSSVKASLPPIHIRLSNVTEMYETWSVGDVVPAGIDFNSWPAGTAVKTTGQNLTLPTKQEEKDYILFVHGWNMPPWEKETFASTMYKRLWHQGYKGRFGTFRWPTFHGMSSPLEEDSAFHLAHFDGSEERAWHSAAPLAVLATSLANTFKDPADNSLVRYYAHSMGNVVTSEALRRTAPHAPVHTYVSAQAALSSRVWDATTPQMDFPSPFWFKTPDVHGHYWPDGTIYEPAGSSVFPSYMAPSAMPANTRFINHYNPFDWALSWDNWQRNQALKPDVHYNYSFPEWDTVNINPRFWAIPNRNLVFPADRHEIFSYAAQSYGYATGQMGNTAGKFNIAESVNLRAVFSFEEEHKGHSAQYRSTIQKRWDYWTQAVEDMETQTPKK